VIHVEPIGGLRRKEDETNAGATNKSFLVLFFKKELLPSHLPVVP
jgi:hypothetical protein